MIRVEFQRWGQSLEDLRSLALRAEHPRTRERSLALSLIADGTHNATSWAARSGRQDETVLRWLHTYNTRGPDALTYRRPGGHPPPLRPSRPGSSSTSSRRPSRSATACPATAGPRRSCDDGPWTASVAWSDATPSAGSCWPPG
jgi:hypothetical protein